MKKWSVFLPVCLLAAAQLAGCGRVPAGEKNAPSAVASPAPASPEAAGPVGCPDFDQAMAGVEGPGSIDPAYTDAETCLQNAYALAAALYRGDANAAAAACDAAAGDNGTAVTQDDRFPFADLTGLRVDGVAFSGGGEEEPLWLTLSVAEPGAAPLPRGTVTYAVEFGDGYYTAAGCVQALVPRENYLPQQGAAYAAVSSFRSWVTTQPWRDAGSLPPVGTAYYLSGFAAGRGLEPSGGTGSGVWDGEVLAGQAQDAFGATPDFLQNRYAAAFTQEGYGTIYDETTDTFLLAAGPGDSGRNRRMTSFTENADGTAALTIARGANSLWMQPDQQVTYTLRENSDGSWAILHADWTGGSKTPEYRIWGTDIRLPDGSSLPETLPLAADLSGTANGGGLTWQQAADKYGVTVEQLHALNPDARCNPDGTINDTLLLDPDYSLPDTGQKLVRILVPWEDYQGDRTYVLPADLDDKACIAAAEALDFLWHYNVRIGYTPAERVEDNQHGAELYQSVQGARFIRYSELKSYLESVFTPELAQEYASGGYEEPYRAYTGYLAGENDELRFGTGERGTSPLVMAQLCTEPMTQPDGSIRFGLLGLEREADSTAGDTPVRAVWHTVRLVPDGDGWRVAEAELAV